MLCRRRDSRLYSRLECRALGVVKVLITATPARCARSRPRAVRESRRLRRRTRGATPRAGSSASGAFHSSPGRGPPPSANRCPRARRTRTPSVSWKSELAIGRDGWRHRTRCDLVPPYGYEECDQRGWQRRGGLLHRYVLRARCLGRALKRFRRSRFGPRAQLLGVQRLAGIDLRYQPEHLVARSRLTHADCPPFRQKARLHHREDNVVAIHPSEDAAGAYLPLRVRGHQMLAGIRRSVHPDPDGTQIAVASEQPSAAEPERQWNEQEAPLRRAMTCSWRDSESEPGQGSRRRSPLTNVQPAATSGRHYIRTKVHQETNAVPKAGLEPACPHGQRILNPPRLPFRHFGLRAFQYRHRRPTATSSATACRA